MSAGSLAGASSFSEGTAARDACFGHSRQVRVRPAANVRGVACWRKLVFRGSRRAGRVLWALPVGAVCCGHKRTSREGRSSSFYCSGLFFHSAARFPQCMQSPVQPLQPPVRCCSMARSANAAAISTSARTTAVPGVITPPPAAYRRAARRRPPPRRWRTARARRRTPTARRAHAGRTRSPRRTAYTAGRTRASSSQKAA